MKNGEVLTEKNRLVSSSELFAFGGFFQFWIDVLEAETPS